MGNIISLRSDEDGEHLAMNNGLTSVFISTLAMALSDLAADDHQRAHAVWIAACDQSIYGRGGISFAAAEMPWRVERLAEDLALYRSALARASSPEVLARLSYRPDLERLTQALERFGALLAALRPEDVDVDAARRDLAAADAFERCPTHGAYLHSIGCVVCND